MFKDKLIKRDLSLKVFDAGEPRQSGQIYKVSIALKEGISRRTPRRSPS